MSVYNTIEYMITIPLPHGAEGYIVIASLYNGTSSGGLRVAPDIDPAEVFTLAREMSLKFALSSLPRGGAKSAIRLPSSLDQNHKIEVLKAFGSHCSSIINSGIYYPGMDMNCGPNDLRTVYAGAGITLRDITDSSFHTALTAAAAINAVQKFDSKSATLTVAVEGFGSVISHLLPRLSLRRFKIQAVSTIAGAVFKKDGFIVERLIELKAKYGDAFVEELIKEGAEFLDPKERLLELNVDVLVPSARVGVINKGNVVDIKARYIVPVSNGPYSENTASILQRQGITCLPGFACNLGGVLGSTLQDLGWKREKIEQFIQIHYQPFLLDLLCRARQTRISPILLAERIAKCRLESRCGSSQRDRSARLYKLAKLGLFPRLLANCLKIREITAGVSALRSELKKLS